MAQLNPQHRPPLRAIREARGRSLRNLAGQLDIQPSQLSKIERGEVIPSLPTLHKIAVGVGLDELVAVLTPWLPNRKPEGASRMSTRVDIDES